METLVNKKITETIPTLRDNKFYYFEGTLQRDSDTMFIDFSTGFNGRGDAIELKISDGVVVKETFYIK